MKKITLSIFTFLFSLCLLAQTTIYSEDFTGQNGKGAVGGSTVLYDTTGVSWSIVVNEPGLTASSDYFQVVNEKFEARDIDQEQVWQSDPINISGYTNINLSLFVEEVGNHETSDYVDFEYSTDGGVTFTKLFNYNGLGDASHTLIDDFDTTTISVSNLSGSSLVIRLSLLNNAGTEYLSFDNIIVSGILSGTMFATISAQSDASCFGASDGSATVTVNNGTANYDYNWSNGSSTVSSSSTSNTITGLSAGSYTVTITDANSNTATAVATIGEPSALAVTFNTTNVSCNGGADGAISASVNGGLAPYTFSWASGAIGNSITALSATNYTVTVTDANGCTASSTETVTEPNVLGVILDSLSAPLCSGDANGSALAKGFGGTAPYTFDWSNGSQEIVSAKVAAQSFESNAADTWNYTESPTSYTASGDIWAVVSSLSSISPSDQANFWGMQDLDNGNGGGSFYHTLTFDPVDVSAATNAKVEFDYYTIGFDSADELEYEVVFDNGTSWSTNGTALNKSTNAWTTVSVPVPSATNFVRLRIQASQNGADDYAAIDNVRITADADTLTSKEMTLSSGAIAVTVTDANGCSASVTDSLASADPVRASILFITNPSSSSSNGSLDARASGGTAPYTYAWSSGANTQTVSNLGQGTYTLTVTDANGCSSTDVATIGGPDCPASILPSNLEANSITSSSALLDWDGISGTNVYYLVRYKVSGQANWQTFLTTTEDSLLVTGLMPNTSYLYIVRTNCNGNWSGQAFNYFRTLSNDCALPTGIGEQWVLGTQVKLTWTADPNTSRYQIRYKDSASTTWNSFYVNATFDFYWLRGLSNLTTYDWQIRSQCRFSDNTSTDWSSLRSFTTGGSALPAPSMRKKEESLSLAPEMQLYPNPSAGMLTVVIPELKLGENASLEVLDISGRKVKQFSARSAQENQIDLNDLENGVYFIRLVDKPEMVHKLILQK